MSGGADKLTAPDRQDRDDDHRHPDGEGGHRTPNDVGIGGGPDPGHVLGVQHIGPQHHLKRPLAVVVQVEQGVEEGVPVIALATQESVLEKTVSNIKEVKARGAEVMAITHEEHVPDLLKSVDQALSIPKTLPLLTPALSVVPLQLLAYYASLARGNDVDKPRNLAKSVTVE